MANCSAKASSSAQREKSRTFGAGIKILDVEDGWNFAHEDLLKGQIGVLDGVNLSSERDHGTAVLGIVSGDINAFGIHGIVPVARIGAVSAIYDQTLEKWNAAGAIEIAARYLRAGDVLILEMHAPGPRASGRDQDGYLPVSFWQAEREAIKMAVGKGVYVVEAAGNGGENLDHPAYGGQLGRASDTGAILVVVGASPWQPAPRSRIWWSNWGERLDLQGWGSDIVTAGGRDDADYHDLFDHPESSRCYTQSFGGTSGATPIVAGAVACLSGCLRSAGRPPLPPREMRRLLIETGTPQTDGPDGPASELIGPLPNLSAALEALDL